MPPRWVALTLEEIEAVRAKSKSWGPSKVRECPDWYALKTCVRRLVKLLPKNPKLAAVMQRIDAAESVHESPDEIAGEITPMPAEAPADNAPAIVTADGFTEELAAALAYTVKGQALGDMDDERLGKLREWAEGKGNDRLVAMCRMVMADRQRDAVADAFDAEEVEP